MDVLLVGNYLPDRQPSMSQFTGIMEAGLREAGYPARIVRPVIRLGGFGRERRGLGKWFGYVDKFVLFPARLRAAAKTADVVHVGDQAYALYIKCLRGISDGRGSSLVNADYAGI